LSWVKGFFLNHDFDFLLLFALLFVFNDFWEVFFLRGSVENKVIFALLSSILVLYLFDLDNLALLVLRRLDFVSLLSFNLILLI